MPFGSLTRAVLAGLVLAVVGAVGPTPARAQGGGPGELECCLLLLVPVGARASALGGAVTARSGADAMFRNPAGLAGLDGGRFVIHHSDNATLDSQTDAFSFLFTPYSSTLGISYQLFDKGDIETTDPTGQTTGELRYRDHLVVASFATSLGGGLAAGLSYKIFQERVDCTGLCGGEEYAATTQAVDLGVRWSPTWQPALELGLSVTNAGFDLQVVNAADSDPFPARVHMGVAYDVLANAPSAEGMALRLALDARDQLSDLGSPTLAAGAELDIQDAVFLRAGYALGEGLGTGAAVGLELRYDRFSIGVSRSFVNSVLEGGSEPFQISMGLNF